MTFAPLVPATPLGPASVATVAWRLRGQLFVTAVVKATFAIVPEARMTPLDPLPVALDEQHDPSGRGLLSASDLAPYLGQADVVLTGHAELSPGFTGDEVRIWLAVVQGGDLRVDKWLELDGSARVGAARAHVRIDGMGPLSREWPRRASLLGSVDPRRLRGPLLDIPDGLDWGYFQVAPADQRLAMLRGDEWLALGGIFPRRPKLRAQLPDARAAARLYRRAHAAPRAGEPIALLADGAQIDVDRRCCSIVWRGHAPIDEAELASLHVVAGVELPGRPLAWIDPFAAAGSGRPSRPELPAAHASPVSTGPQALDVGQTSPLTPEEVAKVLASVVTPFDRGPASAPPQRDRPSGPRALTGTPFSAPPVEYGAIDQTNPLSPEEVAKVLASVVTPFDDHRPPQSHPRSGAARPAPLTSLPFSAPGSSGHAPFAPPPSVSPWSAAPPPAPQPSVRASPLEGTMSLSADAVSGLLASVSAQHDSAPPFGAAPRPPAPAAAPPKPSPWSPSPPASAPRDSRPASVAGTPTIGGPAEPRPPSAPATPPASGAALPPFPATRPQADDPSDASADLGAAFLAALDDLKPPT